MNKTTKFNLSNALFTGHALIDTNGKILLDNVTSVQMESGGHKSWNVTGYVQGIEKLSFQQKTIFVTTVD